MTTNIHPVHGRMLDREYREAVLQQRSCVVWITGLSGSGKSTIGITLEKRLFELGYFSQLLDGDNIRTGLNNNLGFSIEDRHENIRRIAEVAKLYVHSGVIAICSFVSPTKKIRSLARDIIGEKDFLEIFVNTPIEVCEERDVKGLYAKARRGEIKDFTGISSPFEQPENPFLEIKTVDQTIDQNCQYLLQNLLPRISLS